MIHHHYIFVTCNSLIFKEAEGTEGPIPLSSVHFILVHQRFFLMVSVLLKTGITDHCKQQQWKIQLQEFIATAELQFIYRMFQQESAIFRQNILISTAERL